MLVFRRIQEELKKLYFKEFTNTEDWRKKLSSWLVQYILKLAIPSIKSQASQATVTPTEAPTSPMILSTEEEISTHNVAAQLSELFTLINEALPTGILDFSAKDAKELDNFNLARLSLLASTLMCKYDSTILLGSHEINLLYQHRTRLETTKRERHLLLRTLINDTDDILPGWCWFRDLDAGNVEMILLSLAIRDSDASVQQRAIKVLASARICITSDSRDKYLKYFLTNKSNLVRTAGLDYLATTGNIEDIQLIANALADDDSSVREEATRTKLLLMLKSNPSQALSELIDERKAPPHGIVAEMEKHSSAIDRTLFTKALQHPDSTVRTFGVQMLLQRDELSEEQATTLLEDPSLKVREVCYKALIKQGRNFSPLEIRRALKGPSQERQGLLTLAIQPPDPDGVILELYRTFSPDKLLTQIDDLYNIDGATAYRVLALEHFSTIADRVRSDLDNGFETLKQQQSHKFELDEEIHLFFKQRFVA
ncbi:MAG: hypothetical protein J3T61_03675, partial [Candidatus Brocadiales bacterium]|nr:hypothetical protein [Candidatus Bathyanammoxibius sp.]